MTGIFWGECGDYFGEAGRLRREEIQTRRDGSLRMHGRSTTVGYNVPTPGYVAYLQRTLEPAVDLGVSAVFLEEPEYWADAGWSASFREAWARRYGEPWRPPDSSVDAQYQASRLKYELYADALRDVIRHLKQRAAARGQSLECHVPTHSLLNYAHWRIVSPESRLMDLPEADGYVAQVWTGTARTPNVYRGNRRERTFETAFLEYGQTLAMVRPTGRKVWFLADPIEDNPDRSWADYRRNYERTVAASLFWPEQFRFEVLPWPSRIFQGAYPEVDLEQKTGRRVGIPADYASEILTVFNALNDMRQDRVAWDAGSRGIGILVSDTMMFQRADPAPSDEDLSSFYGLALPLLKAGIPVEPIQLETVSTPGALDRCHTLLLTYEGQKPLRSAYHDRLAAWVRGGGGLVYVGDGSDPYDAVRAWWNAAGTQPAGPADDLFARLGAASGEHAAAQPVGQGWVRILHERPRSLARRTEGPEIVLEAVASVLAPRGMPLRTQGYLKLQRGPYVTLAVLDETAAPEALELPGAYVDLFDPSLGVVQDPRFEPGACGLLLDLAAIDDRAPRVLAAAARVRTVQVEPKRLACVTRGPSGSRCRMRIRLPAAPTQATIAPEAPLRSAWHAPWQTLLLEFDNRGADVAVSVDWP